MGENRTFEYLLPANAKRIITPLRLVNAQKKQEMLVNALWDTGAEFSAVGLDAVAKVDMESLGVVKDVCSINGKSRAAMLCTIVLPGDDYFALVTEAVMHEIGNKDYSFVIGMNIIRKGDFSLTQTNDGLLLRFVFGPKFIQVIKEKGKSIWNNEANH